MKHLMAMSLTLAVISLAGCGVDGEPTTPVAKAKHGLSITGRAEVGVAKRW